MLYTIKRVKTIGQYLDALNDYYPQTIKYSKELVQEFFEYFKNHAQENDTMKYCYARLLYCEPEFRENLDNLNESFKLLNDLVEKNYTVAHFSLGICYALGYGTTADPEKAVEHLKISADEGHAFAEYILYYFNLNECYDENKNLVKTKYIDISKKDANAYLHSACEKDYYEAILCYVKWFKHCVLSTDIFDINRDSTFSKRHFDKLYDLMKKAALQDSEDPYIYYELGSYLLSDGNEYTEHLGSEAEIDSDDKEALFYLNKCAELNDSYLNVNTKLAIAYLNNQESEDNLIKGLECFIKAIKNDEPDCKHSPILELLMWS